MPRYIGSNHRSENPVEATRRWSVYIFPEMHVYVCFDCEQVLSDVQISSNHARIAELFRWEKFTFSIFIAIQLNVHFGAFTESICCMKGIGRIP